MKKKICIAVLMVAALMLSACNFPLFKKANDQDVDALATAVVETVQALDAQPAPPEEQPQPPEGALPTITPLPTLTTPPVQQPPTATPLPCNKALFLSETIPDDTEFGSGEAFTKSWTFKNVGTCTWNSNYEMVFATGDQMSGPASVSLPASVAPNTEVTISVDLTSPIDPGAYTGYWKLHADDDEQFGQVYVRIVTKSVLFQVTSVTYYMPHTTIDMACPGDVVIKGEISTSTAGKVTYYWTNSDAGQSATTSLTYDAADKQIVEYTMTVAASGDYWAKIYIDKPNHQLFGPKNFHVNCTP